VVDLLQGEWLEFELGSAPEPHEMRAVGPDGEDVPVRIDRSTRGVRVTATAPATIAKIVTV
jgi:endoglucanase